MDDFDSEPLQSSRFKPGGGKRTKGLHLPKRAIYPRTIIDRLQQQLKEQQQLQQHLKAANAQLRQRESSLLVSVAGLGEGLHHMGKALFVNSGSSGSLKDECFMTASLAALAQDLEAHELLQTIGRDTTDSDSLVTTQCMRSGATPERVQAAQALLRSDPAAFEAQMAQQLQTLTFRMSYYVKHKRKAEQFMSSSLEALGRQYIENVMLMFVVDATLLPRLCLLNLDTRVEESPPAGLWEAVAAVMQPTNEQVQQLSAAVQADGQKRMALAPRMHRLVREIRQLLEPISPQQQQQRPLKSQESSASGSNATRSSSGGGADSIPGSGSTRDRAAWSPWQQFGLSPATGPFDEGTVEQLERLLLQLNRDLLSWRILNHNMMLLMLNTMTLTQLVAATTQAYPWFLQPVALIHAIVHKGKG